MAVLGMLETFTQHRQEAWMEKLSNRWLSIFSIWVQKILTSMLQRNSQGLQQTQAKRKSKEGDWTCLRCSNYNYSFRSYCNRCRAQSKHDNENAVAMITYNNYGQNSFPSALFISLGPLRIKESKQTDIIYRPLDEQPLCESKWLNQLLAE